MEQEIQGYEEEVWEAELDEEQNEWYTIAVYCVSRQYGGPEEGGWWYDAGERMDSIPPIIVHDEDAVPEALRTMDKKVEELGLNEGARPLSSVLSTGEYQARFFRKFAPKFFPETRPFYE